MIRREFLRQGSGTAVGGLSALLPGRAVASEPLKPSPLTFDARAFGARGDGTTIDSPAVNRAIEAASTAGGGTVKLPAGVYACYTVRLKSHVSLHLHAGATLLAASVPDAGTSTGGYDAAGPPQAWERFQDFGHNHWADSLLYGEGLDGVSIYGPGLIWGKGLSRGEASELPRAESPGVGNKAIALKNCRNVILRDFSMLAGGHFAVLFTGVDNVVIDGLTIDTNRDGIDIDYCCNVRVSNVVVNSPWDDAICPKSSLALGYARVTENVTISNCYVTGMFEYGTLLDGTFKRATYDQVRKSVGRTKCGTESNGGFRNIMVTNCILEGCSGFALETVDGALIEDITVSNLTMRGVVHSPILLRLGARMRVPAGTKPGVLRRVLFSNITNTGAVAQYPTIVAGLSEALIEDIRFDSMYLGQVGGAPRSGLPCFRRTNPPAILKPTCSARCPRTACFFVTGAIFSSATWSSTPRRRMGGQPSGLTTWRISTCSACAHRRAHHHSRFEMCAVSAALAVATQPTGVKQSCNKQSIRHEEPRLGPQGRVSGMKREYSQTCFGKFVSRVVLGLVVGLVSLLCVPPMAAQIQRSATRAEYRNPILFADYSDPDVIRDGNDYYLVASSFHFVPGLPILHSRDMAHWEIVGHAVERLTMDPAYDMNGGSRYAGGVWAPAVRSHAGRFYIFFPTPNEGIFMVSAPHMTGPWTKPVTVLAGAGLGDPCPFWDDDGTAWLVHSRTGAGPLILHRMAPDATRMLDEGKVIVDDPVDLQTLEGPKLYKRNGWYYIFGPWVGSRQGIKW